MAEDREKVEGRGPRGQVVGASTGDRWETFGNSANGSWKGGREERFQSWRIVRQTR